MSQGGHLENTESSTINFITDSGTVNTVSRNIRISGGLNVQTTGTDSNLVTILANEQVTSKTSNYTPTEDDYFINCTSGTFTISLPNALDLSGKVYEIKNSGTGIITVDGDGLETVDGEETQYIYEDESFTLICDGSGWYVI